MNRLEKPFWESGWTSDGNWTVNSDPTAGNEGMGYWQSTTNGSWIEFDAYLTAGAWEFWLHGPINTNAAIFGLTLDGVDTGARVDLYNSGGLLYDTRRVFDAPVTVATPGLHTLRLVVTGKNASSSAYASYFNHFGGWVNAAQGMGPAGAPGGSNTHVQFNDSGSLGGDADLTWDKTTNILTIGDTTEGTIRGAPNADGVGGTLLLKGGNSAGEDENDGGEAHLIGGTPANGGGGTARVYGGDGVGTNMGGGNAALQGGIATGTEAGGNVTIIGGANSGTGNGGRVIVQGGQPGEGGVAGKIELLSNVKFVGATHFLGFVTSEAAPTTAELPADKDFAIHKDTVLGTIRLVFNSGGSIKSIILA